MFNFLTDLAGKYPIVKCLPKSLITDFPYCSVPFCPKLHHLMDRPISLVTPFSDLRIKLFDLLIVRASDLGECFEQLAERSKIMFRWVFVVYTLSARFEPILNYACTNRDTLDKNPRARAFAICLCALAYKSCRFLPTPDPGMFSARRLEYFLLGFVLIA